MRDGERHAVRPADLDGAFDVMAKREKSSEPSQRRLRVGEELRHGLARILQRDALRDPAMHGVTVTITEVRVSPDLKNATAFVMPLGGAHAEEVVAALRRGAPFLRRELAREVPLRYAPGLAFELDTSFDHATRINELLHRPEVVRDLDAEEPSGEETDDGA